jgi:hypothetical protein
MGFFGDLKGFFGSTAEFVVEAGGQVLTAAADLENMTVELAGEVWDAIPGELLAPGLGPLAGVLKNELEDELFMMVGPSGVVVGLGVFPVQVDQAAQALIGGAALLHAIKHRSLNDEEWAMATWVFNEQLPPRGNIHLTNFGVPNDSGFFDRAIVFPAIANQYYINMGADYHHRSSIADGPLLLHELTHVWQSRNKLFRDIQILAAAKDRDYEYTYGSQWRDYGLEQQGTIVQDWARGTIERNQSGHPDGGDLTAGPLSIGSPLFRYVHRNLRQNDNGANSQRSRSVRTLAEPFPSTNDLRLSMIHPGAPERWWEVER